MKPVSSTVRRLCHIKPRREQESWTVVTRSITMSPTQPCRVIDHPLATRIEHGASSGFFGCAAWFTIQAPTSNLGSQPTWNTIQGEARSSMTLCRQERTEHDLDIAQEKAVTRFMTMSPTPCRVTDNSLPIGRDRGCHEQQFLVQLYSMAHDHVSNPSLRAHR